MKRLFTVFASLLTQGAKEQKTKMMYVVMTLVMMMLAPQGTKADIVTTTYDFAASVQNGNTTTQYSDQTIKVGNVNCTIFTTLGNVQNPERFASQNTGMILRSASSSSGTSYGLCETGIGTNQYRTFAIQNLYAGDVVTINGSSTFSLTSGNATADGNTFTMTEKGALGISLAGTQWIYSITIQHDDVASWNYDPATEIYDLYNITGSFSTSDADFQLNGSTAKYLTNLQSGMALNNRIAVNGGTSNWAFNDHGLKSLNSWNNLSICNLREGDRVVIQYTGEATISSNGQNGGYNGCAAFKDIENDGDFNGQDVNIANGMTLDAKTTGYDYNINTNSYITYAYTVTEDGHLDIGLSAGSRIFKITIYGDHQARMVDRYNGAGQGSTSYFDTTGQLEAKHHIVPGGLHVYVGNEDESQHAEVVMSDKGPVSFVYDGSHFKMARYPSWGNVNLWSELPVTGTYYRFVPEVSGKMTVRLKANSITYHNYGIAGNAAYDQWGTPNEVTSSTQCPYFLMAKNGTTPQYISSQSKGNGADLTFENIDVTAGQTYYIYGWWVDGAESSHLQDYYCGVAQLIDVTFKPTNYIYPLAKTVKNGATVANEPILSDLADVIGYTDVCVKKKSDNIESCTVAIEGGKLKVKSISYKEGTNPGGVVLIKVGDKNDDATPVFALTIAYDAEIGHKWDFSDKSLNGLKWTNRDTQEATATPFGTSQESNSLLSQEIAKGDWTFNYRVKSGNTTHDPRYLNAYDMEGDNADMIWDTEGLVFNTSSNQSCIYNEFGGDVNHSKEEGAGGTATDPDRYVGILPGGSFTIPGLEEGDRVVIFMGSGDGSGSEACFFNITNACDAIGNEITSVYKAGGSGWSGDGGRYQYRGAYQFISEGGDMEFKMVGGSMTKLYSIEIYTGTKSGTVDGSKTTWSTTYNDAEYQPGYQVYNDYNTTTPACTFFTIHYRGKGERLRTPTVVYKSGNINTDANHLFYGEIGNNNAPYIFFKSEKEQYGMFRIRIDDMELGRNYVADYALQNVTVGYLEKKNYPYTWDFTDLKGYVETDDRITAERTKVGKYGTEEVITGVSPETLDGTNYIEFMNYSVGDDVKSVEQWKSYAKNGNIPAGYGLQVRNEPYSGGLMWSEGQLYAGNETFDETFGLSIICPGADHKYNGGLRITEDGLCLTGGNWKIKVPQVGSIASLYVRATPIGDVTAGVGDATTAFTYVGTATDNSGDKIYAVKGTGADIDLVFNNVIIKKIAISQDPKTVNHLGYATESRNVEIDPELMGYMTGTGLKAYTVTDVVYGNKAGDIPSITLTEIPSANVMGPATTGDHRAYIIYNTDDAVDAPEGTAADAMDANGKTKAVSEIDGGFHLFVPDMHDRNDASNAKKSILDVSGNPLKSHINSGEINQTDGKYTNYLMNWRYKDGWGKVQKGPEAFYRASSGATLGNNKAYLQLLTEKVRPENYSGSEAKQVFAIIFVDEVKGIATTVLDGVKTTEMYSGDNAIYTLSGMKVNNPQKGVIYVKNGKKIVIK